MGFPFARTINAPKKYVVSGTLDRVDWSAELVRGDLETALRKADMKLDAPATIRDRIDDLYRSDSRRVFASLVRLLKDFDLADDAMHEAYAAAVEIWQRDGVPANPRAWLISTGKFKAINALRRQGRLKALQPEIAARVDEVADENAARAAPEIEDDRLRLIFTCCHPAIDP